MELKRAFSWRRVVVAGYFALFAVYLVVGLQPVEATHYEISAELNIPTIGLKSDVTTLTLNGQTLDTPDTIVGSYSRAENKTLLIGHSATVFHSLKYLQLGDKVIYDGMAYRVRDMEILTKAEIDMGEVLAEAKTNTLVIMTCSGKDLGDGDATHRLIVTAEAI